MNQQVKQFRTQYLTIILIVISILISSYARRADTKQPKINPAEIAGKPRPVPTDTFTLADIFQEENTLDGDRVSALAQVLNSHDLVAEISVSSLEIPSETSLQVAMGRALSLMKGLNSHGVNMTNLHVYAKTTNDLGNSAEVKLYGAP